MEGAARGRTARRVEHVDLNDVELFVSVVEAGSFTGAARARRMPKSAVSRRIARLEQSLGAKLLVRTTRRLDLTEAGALYRDEAARSLEALAAARETLGSLQEEPRGTVRLSAPPDMERLLAKIIVSFVRRYPRVSVEMDLSSRKVDLVAERFDVAIRGGTIHDDRLVAKLIRLSTLVLVAAPRYLARRGKLRRVEDLARHDCIVAGERGLRARWRLLGPDGPKRVEVSGPVSANEMRFRLQLAVEGAGILLIPLELCAADLHRRRLVRVLPAVSGEIGAVNLVWPPSPFVPARVQLVRDHLFRELKKIPWPDVASG